MASNATDSLIDPQIFTDLQNRIDEDAQVRDKIRDVLQALERQERTVQSILSKAHSTAAKDLQPVLQRAEAAIKEEIQSVGSLAAFASDFPYYKYNGLWTRSVQNVVYSILLCGWLGGITINGQSTTVGQLLTIEDVGQLVNVPVNLKDQDKFHITIEEYLHALINLIEELSRLAINSVTLGDYQRPPQIAQFVKDIHAGFQILNLKNDSLRRRSDSIKYSVKKVEDVVYDLSLRNLLPRAA